MQVLTNPNSVPIKMWTDGVPVEEEAVKQLRNVAAMPFVFKHVAVMPDVHVGVGATIGSVVPTKGAIIPAAVGVDIGCGMMAVETTLNAAQLPDNLHEIRTAIEAAVPHGRTDNGGRHDKGGWNDLPVTVLRGWIDKYAGLADGWKKIIAKEPKLEHGNLVNHLGTLGTGNHFIEICLDENDHVWVMLHSGSRGVGNRIGMHYIAKAKEDMKRWFINIPDIDLAYLPEGSEVFNDYVYAVGWAQDFAAMNRQLMMNAIIAAIGDKLPPFELTEYKVNCHHNYISKENHFGQNVWITRKGAVRARAGEFGIIPGSMGAKSFIVKGRGNAESFTSCSHGAGRRMSRTAAKKQFTVADHEKATAGIECRKDEDVIDETPMAYKDIDAVMTAQNDLVEIVHTLHQVVCVKG